MKDEENCKPIKDKYFPNDQSIIAKRKQNWSQSYKVFLLYLVARLLEHKTRTVYWLNYWHTLISKDVRGFTSDTLLIRFPIMLSVCIFNILQHTFKCLSLFMYYLLNWSLNLSQVNQLGCALCNKCVSSIHRTTIKLISEALI